MCCPVSPGIRVRFSNTVRYGAEVQVRRRRFTSSDTRKRSRTGREREALSLALAFGRVIWLFEVSVVLPILLLTDATMSRTL